MPIMLSHASKPPLARLMAFIDGGYLREQCQRKIKTDEINYEKLKLRLESEFNANCGGKYAGDLIRVYYYDAIVDPTEPEYSEQNEKFSKIKNNNGFEVRLGRLVRSGGNKEEKFKQKGVDVMLAVEMVSTAYQDQYEFALLIASCSFFEIFVDTVGILSTMVYRGLLIKLYDDYPSQFSS